MAAAAEDPREVQPERPTVATHAYSVAPGYLETEIGVQFDRQPDGVSDFLAPVNAKIGLTDRLQLNLASAVVRSPGQSAGIGDATLGLKWRIGRATPLLGDFALLPSLKFPTGSAGRGTGTDSTDVSVLAISSRTVGSVSVDLNAGYTRRSNGRAAARDATIWAVSASGPFPGDFGWNLEIFGFPGTSGPFGEGPIVGATVGPTWQPRPWIAFDAGAYLRIEGPQPNALFAGFTWNVGRLW
ncbi:MAG TPA: transporter [Thermoanaerobaculia bacterium]|nr:transporter [Thermoanaerobaculia bacterium]